jgi:hypothetical protein
MGTSPAGRAVGCTSSLAVARLRTAYGSPSTGRRETGRCNSFRCLHAASMPALLLEEGDSEDPACDA